MDWHGPLELKNYPKKWSLDGGAHFLIPGGSNYDWACCFLQWYPVIVLSCWQKPSRPIEKCRVRVQQILQQIFALFFHAQ
jgi:hypothetical protein